MHHLQVAKLIKSDDYLEFDLNTLKNLELVETLRDRTRKYSLYWLLDKCSTAMGSRYLKQNIENPLTNEKDINYRYNLVEKLNNEFLLRNDLDKLLNQK